MAQVSAPAAPPVEIPGEPGEPRGTCLRDRVARELAHWSAIGSEAERVCGWDTPVGRLRAARRVEEFVSRGRLGPRVEALELGCGSGAFTELVHRAGARITASDLSEEMLRQVRRRGLEGCRVERADAHRLSFASSSFDVVYGSSILHHLELRPALGEVFRVLRRGGRMVFAEPNMANPHVFLQKNVPLLRRLTRESPDETAFWRGPLARRLREAGFVDVSVRPFDFLHPLLPVCAARVLRRGLRALEAVPALREIAGSLAVFGRKP
jgi:SAM-dependent methyltransferase